MTSSNECARLQLHAKLDDSESKRHNAVSQSGNQPKDDDDDGADNQETVKGKCFVLCMPQALYAYNAHTLSCVHASIWH